MQHTCARYVKHNIAINVIYVTKCPRLRNLGSLGEVLWKTVFGERWKVSTGRYKGGKFEKIAKEIKIEG